MRTYLLRPIIIRWWVVAFHNFHFRIWQGWDVKGRTRDTRNVNKYNRIRTMLDYTQYGLSLNLTVKVETLDFLNLH